MLFPSFTPRNTGQRGVQTTASTDRASSFEAPVSPNHFPERGYGRARTRARWFPIAGGLLCAAPGGGWGLRAAFDTETSPRTWLLGAAESSRPERCCSTARRPSSHLPPAIHKMCVCLLLHTCRHGALMRRTRSRPLNFAFSKGTGILNRLG